MKLHGRNAGGFSQSVNRPMYQMAGGFSLGQISPNKASNTKATDAEIDDYMQTIRNAVDKKYDMVGAST